MEITTLQMAIYKILEAQEKAVMKNLDEALRIVPKKVARQLKASSPVKSGTYRKGWATKRTGLHSVVVYNKRAPSLTHLLENGHLGKNKSGVWGRVRAIPHIGPAEQEGVREFYEIIKKMPIEADGPKEYKVKL